MFRLHQVSQSFKISPFYHLNMSQKRITIYDLAKELGISPSYISRALNEHPSINKKVVESVKKKAQELNYSHNSHAANLRQGSSKTIGVIVPHINQSFFSEVISGIEEVCFENNHSLVICQSHELYKQECKAVETLIHQNVDCILISIASETKSIEHLQSIKNHRIELIQFDRFLENVDSVKVFNNNKEVSYDVTKILIEQQYKRIAFLGGPNHLTTFQHRKEGFLAAINDCKVQIPTNFIVENVLSKEKAIEVANELLNTIEPPDAFLTVSDHQSLGVLQVAQSKGIIVPEQLGIFGFANEEFTSIIQPTLSTVDQRSKQLGRKAANIYFKLKANNEVVLTANKEEIVSCEILERNSSIRKKSV